MGRGLSSLQQDIMKHASAKGFVHASDAVGCALQYSGNYLGSRSSASRALRRLCNRGLLKFFRKRYVNWLHFYYLPSIDPLTIEHDRWGHTEVQRQALREKHEREQEDDRERTKNMTQEERLADCEAQIMKAFAAMAGNG